MPPAAAVMTLLLLVWNSTPRLLDRVSAPSVGEISMLSVMSPSPSAGCPMVAEPPPLGTPPLQLAASPQLPAGTKNGAVWQVSPTAKDEPSLPPIHTPSVNTRDP